MTQAGDHSSAKIKDSIESFEGQKIIAEMDIEPKDSTFKHSRASTPKKKISPAKVTPPKKIEVAQVPTTAPVDSKPRPIEESQPVPIIEPSPVPMADVSVPAPNIPSPAPYEIPLQPPNLNQNLSVETLQNPNMMVDDTPVPLSKEDPPSQVQLIEQISPEEELE